MISIFKTYISLIFVGAAIIISAAGCSCNKLEEDFLAGENLSLRIKGKTVQEYSPENCQIGFYEYKKQFRVHNDTMSDYYILTCSSLPTSVGQRVHGDLKWSTYSSVSSKKGIEFKVEKIDDIGNIWLWSNNAGIAVSVRRLR